MENIELKYNDVAYHKITDSIQKSFVKSIKNFQKIEKLRFLKTPKISILLDENTKRGQKTGLFCPLYFPTLKWCTFLIFSDIKAPYVDH